MNTDHPETPENSPSAPTPPLPAEAVTAPNPGAPWQENEPAWDPSSLTDSIDELRGEMTAASAEWRRGTKRQMDALKEFGTLIQSMGEMVRDLHQTSRNAAAAAPSNAASSGASTLPDEWLHLLIDLHDRAARTAQALARPPAGTTSFWPAARTDLAAWSQAWTAQAEANSMLLTHLAGLLRRAGLQPIPATGQPFDPATMQAVEAVTDPAIPDHLVIAELLTGWTQTATGRILRPAQVRVSRKTARTD